MELYNIFYEFLKNFQGYEWIIIELDKFYQTYKLNSELELRFHIQKQFDLILKFKPKSKGFESNSDLNWFWFGLKRMENGKA
jgi:hypothetical protein